MQAGRRRRFRRGSGGFGGGRVGEPGVHGGLPHAARQRAGADPDFRLDHLHRVVGVGERVVINPLNCRCAIRSACLCDLQQRFGLDPQKCVRVFCRTCENNGHMLAVSRCLTLPPA